MSLLTVPIVKNGHILVGIVQFLFSRSFLLALTKFSYWKEDWALGYEVLTLFLAFLSCLATREATSIY